MTFVTNLDHNDKLYGFIDGLHPSVMEEVEKWEPTTWEEVIKIAE